MKKSHRKLKQKKAINDILGATAARHALQDISNLKSHVHREIRAKTVNNKIKKLESEREEFGKDIDSKKARKLTIPQERIIYIEQKKAADRILETHKDTAEIKQRCNKLEKDLDNIISDISSYKTQKTIWLAQNAIHLVSKKIAVKCRAIYEDMERKIQIPAPYHLEFVQDLIASKMCICGRDLTMHSPAYRAVHELLSNAPDSKISRDMINIRSFCDTTLNHNVDLESLIKINSLITNAHEREVEKRTALDEAKKEISSIANTNVSEQSRISIQANHKIVSLNQEEITINNDLITLGNDIRKIDEQVKTLLVNDKLVNKLNKQLKFLELSEEKLQLSINQLEESALETLRTKTNELLNKVYRQNITVFISNNYELLLKDSDNKIAPASGGQGLLASLAFLACLIKFCADREADTNEILIPGTIAPFVLDAPFGDLDPLYRQSAAKFLQEYSNQLVLFVSNSQGDSETIKVIENNIGTRAILVAENIAEQPKSQNGLTEVKVINNVSHVTTLWGCDNDTTRIVIV